MSKQKNKSNFQGKECFSRMNFLYQASMLMAGKNNTLSSYYGELCKNISKKAVLRIEPNVKRDFCKCCSLAQKPGLTSDINVSYRKRKRNKSKELSDEDAQISMSCKLCSYRRNFNINTEYKFWLENPESVAEVCTVKTEEKQKKTDVKNNKATTKVNNNTNKHKY